jgi:hypothetical protein
LAGEPSGDSGGTLVIILGQCRKIKHVSSKLMTGPSFIVKSRPDLTFFEFNVE